VTDTGTTGSRIKYQKAETVVLNIARAARNFKSLREFLPIVHLELGKVMDARCFYLALYSSETGLYQFPYHVDKYDKISTEDWIKLPPNSLTDYVRRSDKALRVTAENWEQITRIRVPVGKQASVWMGAPLKNSDKKSFGTLVVQNYDNPLAYDNDDLNILEFTGIQIGMILENVERESQLEESKARALESEERIRKLYELSKQQQEIMASLFQGAKIILEHPDLVESSSLLLRKCKGLTGADSGFIATIEKDQTFGNIVINDSGHQVCSVEERQVYELRGLRAEAIKSGQTVLENDFEHTPTLNLLPSGHIRIENILIVPMIYNSVVVGLFSMANKPGGFNMEDVSVAEAYAELASLASLTWNNLEELKKARLRAEASDQLKSAFLSNMSHEIRTPLNGILGFSELLREPDLDPEDRDNYIRIINQNGEQLMSIINNILDISMIESGQITLKNESVHLKKILNGVFELFLSPGLRKPDVQYAMDFPEELEEMMIKTDPGRLSQVLVNLFGNATKFTLKGHVLLGCRIVGPADAQELCLYVEDTGPGIPSEKFDQVFERFRKADTSLNRKAGGTGLGLAISKGLTELLGGRIALESTVSIGSTFKVLFPIP
jgi:signal transduction histidine kinase